MRKSGVRILFPFYVETQIEKLLYLKNEKIRHYLQQKKKRAHRKSSQKRIVSVQGLQTTKNEITLCKKYHPYIQKIRQNFRQKENH